MITFLLTILLTINIDIFKFGLNDDRMKVKNNRNIGEKT